MSIHTVAIATIGYHGSFDTDSLPATSIEFAVAYGLKQWLQDGAAAPKGTPDADRLASVMERDARLRSGNVPGVATRVDPLRVMAANAKVTDDEVAAAIAMVVAKREKSARAA